jgi:DNA-binding NtrC family response regulator
MDRPEAIAVLLVEADPTVRRDCADMLGEQFTVLVADSYHAAEQLLNVHDVAVVVTEQDIGEPGGLALIARLQTQRRGTTCVMVAKSIPVGAWDVVDYAFPKPVEPSELRKLIAALVKGRS